MTETAESSGAFEIQFQWTPELIQQHDMYLGFAEFERTEGNGEFIVGIIGFLLMLAGGAVYLAEHYGVLPDKSALMFICGAFFSGVIASFGAARFTRSVIGQIEGESTRRTKAMLNAPASKIGFGLDGITEHFEGGETRLLWSAISELREYQEGLVLMRGERGAIFVPDESLPEDLDRAEARGRFRRWKGPW